MCSVHIVLDKNEMECGDCLDTCCVGVISANRSGKREQYKMPIIGDASDCWKYLGFLTSVFAVSTPGLQNYLF